MKDSVAVSSLFKSFGANPVLQDIALRIDAGTAYGLVGLNGAGKTTLIRLLLGILKPDAGYISVLGHNPWDHSSAMYSSMGVVLEHDGFWGNLTIKQNLRIYAEAKKIAWPDVQKYIEEYWKDTPVFSSQKKVKLLSRGQRMQCALCRAFLGWPELFILDEPAVALDVQAYEHLKRMIECAKGRGAMLLISSHQLDAIDAVCTRVGVLHDQRLKELEDPHTQRAGWYIRLVKDMDQCRKIIVQHGAESVQMDGNGLKFQVNDPEKNIPEIIRAVVGAQIDILEIRPEKNDFSDAIRLLYSGGVR